MATNQQLFELARKKQSSRLMTLLQASKIDLDYVTDSYGNSLYHFAIMTDNLPLLKTLIQYQVPKQTPNIFGETPLTLAVRKNSEEMVRTLLGEEADRLRTDNVVLRSQVAQVTRERDDYRNKFTFAERELNRERESHKRVRDSYNELDKKHRILTTTFNGCKNEIAEMGHESKRLRTENDKLTRDVETYKKTITNLSSAMRK